MDEMISNADLYNYLRSLADLLSERDLEQQLAHPVRFAARQAGGRSTEFFRVSLTALRRVLESEGGALKIHERDELRGVINQVEAALRRRAASL